MSGWGSEGGKNYLRTTGKGRRGNEKGSEKLQLRKEKPAWNIESLKHQREGKCYLECTGEHETGEDVVGKETKKSRRDEMNKRNEHQRRGRRRGTGMGAWVSFQNNTAKQ